MNKSLNNKEISPILVHLIAAQYISLESRRKSRDVLMWQVPVLSFTAQAFFLNIEIQSTTPVFGRLTAAFISIIIGFLAIQLMSKHRHLEEIDSNLLEELEKKYGLLPHHCKLSQMIESLPPENKKKQQVNKNSFLQIFINLSSYKLWSIGLLIPSSASLIIIIITLMRII